MDVDYDEIIRILELFKESDFAYLNIRIGNVSVSAAQKGIDPADVGRLEAGVARSSTDLTRSGGEAAQPTDGAVRLVVDAVGDPEPSTMPPARSSLGGAVVEAPMVGTFYSAPTPEASPYVSVGQVVEAGETLALIEAMKMFTAVEAPRAGTVVEVLAKNGELVEFGQPLFMVDSTNS